MVVYNIKLEDEAVCVNMVDGMAGRGEPYPAEAQTGVWGRTSTIAV